MAKLLFLTLTDRNDAFKGISKKTNWQVEAFEEHGLDVFQASFSIIDKKLSIYNKGVEVITSFMNRHLPQFFSRLYLTYRLAGQIIQERDINSIYMRMCSNSDSLVAYFLKRKFPRLKILMEIPTYPYRNETFNGSLNGLFCGLVDIFCRSFAYNSLDRIVTFSQHNIICGVKTIKTFNGFGFKDLLIPEKREHEGVVFSAVCCVVFWQGIDRFLKSLASYRKPGVLFNIVGDGPALVELREMVAKDSYLRDIVVFHGFLDKNALVSIYESTDIGVGTLGLHRKKIKEANSLKHREYLAMGLPIVYSGCDPLIDTLPYLYQATNDENLIDIAHLLDWYGRLNYGRHDISVFAQEHFSWYEQLKPVVKYIVDSV